MIVALVEVNHAGSGRELDAGTPERSIGLLAAARHPPVGDRA
jgi:hypothetical protein